MGLSYRSNHLLLLREDGDGAAGRLAFIGTGAAGLFVFGAVLPILHPDTRQHAGRQLVQGRLGRLQIVEDAVELRQLGVVSSQLRVGRGDGGFVGREREGIAQIKGSVDGFEGGGAGFGGVNGRRGTFSTGHGDMFSVTSVD